MIVMHIIGNMLFLLFIYLNIKKRLQGKIAIISFIFGCIAYILYILIIIIGFKVYGFDKQSFSILILAWAFENAAYCISNKNV